MIAAYPDMAAAITTPMALMYSFTVDAYAFGAVLVPAKLEAIIEDKIAR